MQAAEYSPLKSNVLAVAFASSARLTSTSGKQQLQHACCPHPDAICTLGNPPY